ncbi:hypothetical protein HX045_12055 [Myroides odoratimimus]|uniref:Uncharacterized protein n=3 Tax=Myroides odoratimimus TaxID=76832 RepID=A0A0S7ED32_9FLAO|nr:MULTISPECIES: hypothetical protein [Myroides]AJA69751.1 hypothetical protein MYRA21_2639 [Myroides sp. A21]ALU27013.1 hypothetical protein AS202_13015 [Myroides odoratimimus]APA93036.1 hypothetical protein BK054_12570 [Myroides sp. ZB35]EHO08646.1 hypothetical protein HMPREF9712_02308 [Myroides odoratimimus CCUG 10230]EHO10596.1 hypothetical protein HMPREF9714_01560 [Myroides odoratimimus CCUG 12901]
MIIAYFKKWTVMRWIRLGLGVLLLFQALDAELWILMIPVLYLFLQAFFNFGCKNDSCTWR